MYKIYILPESLIFSGIFYRMVLMFEDIQNARRRKTSGGRLLCDDRSEAETLELSSVRLSFGNTKKGYPFGYPFRVP